MEQYIYIFLGSDVAKYMSQSGRYTGINMKLGQGNFTVTITSVRNPYLTVP